MAETEATIVRELDKGMFVWFAGDDGEGFREIVDMDYWTPEHGSHEASYGSGRWTTIRYADGHVENRPVVGTYEIWKSGCRPAFGLTPYERECRAEDAAWREFGAR